MRLNKLRGALALCCALVTAIPALAYADTNISFRFNDPEKVQMRAALDVFEKENPGIKVELQTTSWNNARDQFLREAAVGQGPDVAHIAFVWTKELAKAGVVMPIDELTKYGAFKNGFDDFIATDLTMQDGKAYGVPWTADTWAMVYRTDLLKEAGVTDLPKTWDELKAASHAVKEKTGKTGFAFAGGNQVWFPINYYLWSNGEGFVVSDGAGKFKLGVTAPQLASAMDYFKGFITSGDAPASIVSIDQPQDPALLQALLDGDQAIAIMPTNTFRQLVGAYKDAHPGAPVPFMSGIMMAGTQGPQTHLGGRTLVVNANTQHPAAAWKLVQYLTSAGLFEKYYTDQYPAQKSLLHKIKFAPEEAGFAAELADHTRTWGAYSDSPADIGQMWNVTARAVSTALSGQKSSIDAATELLTKINAMLKP